MNRELLMTICVWVIGVAIACATTWIGMAMVSDKETGVPSVIWWVLGLATALLIISTVLPSRSKSE